MLWRFMSDDDIPLTNNEAERALRGYVLWRKGSYGVGNCFASEYCRWWRQPNDWGVVLRNGFVQSSELASRKRITPSLPSCVHQAPAGERLR